MMAGNMGAGNAEAINNQKPLTQHLQGNALLANGSG